MSFEDPLFGEESILRSMTDEIFAEEFNCDISHLVGMRQDITEKEKNYRLVYLFSMKRGEDEKTLLFHHVMHGHVAIVGSMLRVIMRQAVKHFYKLRMVSKAFLTEGLVYDTDSRNKIFACVIDDRLRRIILQKHWQLGLHDFAYKFSEPCPDEKSLKHLLSDCREAETLATLQIEQRITTPARLFFGWSLANRSQLNIKFLFLNVVKYLYATGLLMLLFNAIFEMFIFILRMDKILRRELMLAAIFS